MHTQWSHRASGLRSMDLHTETLRREIKADIRKQHDLYVNNLVGDVKATSNPKDFIGTSVVRKRTPRVGLSPTTPSKKRNDGRGVAQSESEKAAEFNDQFTYVFTKSGYNQVPLLDRSVPFMEYIVATKEEVTKLLKYLNPSNAPINIFPQKGGGGGDTLGIRQQNNPNPRGLNRP